LLASTARADGSRVVLLRPAGATSETDEAINRARAELRTEGFVAVVRNAPAEGDPRTVLSRAAKAEGAIAAISMFQEGPGTVADLWVIDRVTGKTVIRTVSVSDVPPEERPATLAIRAVELLRASLVEALHPPESTPQRKLPEDVSRWLEPARSPLAGPFVHLGVAMLISVDELGPAGAPLVRVGYGSDEGIAVRLTMMGPAFGANGEGPLGSASVRQELLALELAWAPIVDWAGFTPMLWVGAGGYHLFADGELHPPNRGKSDHVWSAALLGGGSIGYRLTTNIAAMLDGGVLFTLPRAVVTMQGDAVGSAGRPSVVAALGVVARF
jgi:hypothetical protein